MTRSSVTPVSIDRRGLVRAGGALALAAAFWPGRVHAQAKLRIGVIGSGHIGGTIGGMWVKAGHPVMFSSRHPDELKDLVAGLGELAKAGTVEQAIAFGDVLFIAVPYGALPQIGQDYGAALKGKIMLDACNAVASRDGGPIADEVEKEGVGVVSQKYLAGARIVRAFNTTQLQDLRQRGEPSRPEACDPDRRRRSRGSENRLRAYSRYRLRSGRGRQACRSEALSARRSGLRPRGDCRRTPAEAVAHAMKVAAALDFLGRAGDAAGAGGGAVVVCLFLRAACRLLRAAAVARPDGHRRRRQEPAVAVHRDLRDAARGAAAVRRAGREAATRALHSGRLSFFCRQSRRCSGCC